MQPCRYFSETRPHCRSWLQGTPCADAGGASVVTVLCQNHRARRGTGGYDGGTERHELAQQASYGRRRLLAPVVYVGLRVGRIWTGPTQQPATVCDEFRGVRGRRRGQLAPLAPFCCEFLTQSEQCSWDNAPWATLGASMSRRRMRSVVPLAAMAVKGGWRCGTGRGH